MIAGLGLGDLALLGALVAVLPALSIHQLVLLRGHLPPRMSIYLSSMVTISVLGVLSVGLGWGAPGPAAMGLALPGGWLPLAGWTLGLTVAAFGLDRLMDGLARAVGSGPSALLRHVLPRTPAEKRVFVLVSLTAGIGEELAYRGFAQAALTVLMGSPWGAAAVASATFGVLHAYQGWMGILFTGALGGIYAASVLVTGSLWPAVLSHVLVDLLTGLVLRDLLFPDLEDPEGAGPPGRVEARHEG